MQSLCVNPGAHGISLPVFFGGASTHPAQVCVLGRGGAGLPISLQSFLSSLLERKSAASPRTSFWLAGDKGNERVALEGSVSVVRAGRKREDKEEEGEEEGDERKSTASPSTSFWLAGEKGNDGVALEDSVSDGQAGRKREEEEEDGVEGGGGEEEEPMERKRRGNWVLRIVQIAALWAEKARRSSGGGGVEERKDEAAASGQGDCCWCEEQGLEVCCVGDGEEAVAEFDKVSFSKMLRRVPLEEVREYAKMSHLGNLAYRITKIKVYE